MIHEKTFTERLSMLISDGGERAFERKTGVSEANIRKYLTGVGLPTLRDLEKIAIANKVSIGWLIGEEEHPNRTASVHQHGPNTSLHEMALWISEQQDGINYWEVAKAKLAQEYPEFREWLKTIYTVANTVANEVGDDSNNIDEE